MILSSLSFNPFSPRILYFMLLMLSMLHVVVTFLSYCQLIYPIAFMHFEVNVHSRTVHHPRSHKYKYKCISSLFFLPPPSHFLFRFIPQSITLPPFEAKARVHSRERLVRTHVRTNAREESE